MGKKGIKWDGKIRLYTAKRSWLPVGLEKRLRAVVASRSIPVEVKYNPRTMPIEAPEASQSAVETFLRETRVRVQGKLFPLRKAQFLALWFALQANRKVIVSPTASGKSLIIYKMIEWYFDWLKSIGKKALVVVPSTTLVEQLYGDFEEYDDTHDLKIQPLCHRLYSGHAKTTSLPIMISTWQSLQNQPPNYFDQFALVVIDEVHQAKATQLQNILKACTQAEVRFGLTGSLDDQLVHHLMIEGFIGDITQLVKTQDMIDEKVLPPVKIIVRALKYAEKDRKIMNYLDERDYLMSLQNRYDYLMKLVGEEIIKGNTMLLFDRIDYGKVLCEGIQKRYPHRPVYFVDGSTKVDEREYVRSIMDEHNDAIIVASYGVFSTGISINRLHQAVFATPFKSKIRLLQSIGRVLRADDEKDQVIVYDICDDMRKMIEKDGTMVKAENYGIRHFRTRQKYYKNEGFPIIYEGVDMKENA